MSQKLPVIWEADPHTIAKIAILKGYLKAWLRILGATRKDETILYVDGFAGPGRYSNHDEGSPLGALQVARNTFFSMGKNFVARKFHGAFIESDAKRFAVLAETVAPFERIPALGVTKLCCEFSEGIKQLKQMLPGPFSGKEPLFVFADPFGGTGIPFQTFTECMEGETAELLINLDSDGIARIFFADNNKRDEQLTELFGNESWRTALTAARDLRTLSIQILDLYKSRLKSIPGVTYVWSFAMRGGKDALNYHLVFATKHPLGLEKMKEAMRAIDTTGSYSFSDAHVDQMALFRDDNDKWYADKLFERFEGQVISMKEADEFALTETPFITAKPLLRVLEEKNWLQVEMHDGLPRRPMTFPDGKVHSLRFDRFDPLLKQGDFFE